MLTVRQSIIRKRKLKNKIWPVFKWILCLLVILFVGKRAFDLWKSSPDQVLIIHYHWLVLAGIVYLLGWIPSVWFFQKLFFRAGGEVSMLTSARAYYCGHLGKYIPGKALVLVIRASLVSHSGIPGRVAGLMAAYETLVMMGAGAALSVALFPFFFNQELIAILPEFLQSLFTHPQAQHVLNSSWLLPVAVIIISILLLPLIAKLFTFAATKMSQSVPQNGPADFSQQIDSRFLLIGLLIFVLSWCMMGLSLGLILKGVGVENRNWSDIPMWTGVVSLATVVGFVAIFAPGGVGVREGILIGILSQQVFIGEKSAVAAAFLLRVVWLLAEVSLSVILYYGVEPRKTTPLVKHPENSSRGGS
jgi:glycosyltransferase 2 family protein